MARFEREGSSRGRDRSGGRDRARSRSSSGDSGRGSRFGRDRDSSRSSRFGRDRNDSDRPGRDRNAYKRFDMDSTSSRGRGSSRGREGGSSRGKDFQEFFKVKCDECGVKCEVPFKPTLGKPVLCSDCYSKSGKSNNTEDVLAEINKKLDKIMNAMSLK